jgi:CRP-like cAMP-binding protein
MISFFYAGGLRPPSTGSRAGQSVSCRTGIYRPEKCRGPPRERAAYDGGAEGIGDMRYYSRIVKKYAKGDIVFSENTESDGMYIIDSGRVRVFKKVGDKDGAGEIELCTLGPRAMFGEMALIDDGRRSASVQAIEATSCTLITKKIFEDQMGRIPVWMVNMIRILVLRLRETNDKLRAMVQQYTTPPNDDMGTTITVDAGGQAPKDGEADGGGKAPAAERLVEPEKIIDDLFSNKNTAKAGSKTRGT